MFNFKKKDPIQAMTERCEKALKPLTDQQVRVLFEQLHELEEDVNTYLVKFCMKHEVLNPHVLQNKLYDEVLKRPGLAHLAEVARVA